MAAAVLVFLALFSARTTGFLGFILRSPGAIDGTSLRLWVSFGLWPISLALAIWLSAAGLGRRMLGEPRDVQDRIVAAALGLACLGQAVFFLGWAGLLRPWAPAVLGTVAALAAASARLPGIRRPKPSPAAGAAGGLLAFAALSEILKALSPAVDWDVRAYHLAIPELALRSASLFRIPWMIHSHWPHMMETLYILPLSVGRDGAAALVHLVAAILLVAAVFLVGRRAAGTAAGWPAALLLAAQPAFLREAGTAHADAACALFAFTAGIALGRWGEDEGDRTLAVAGLLAGACAAAKMTGLAMVAGGTAFAAFRRRRARDGTIFAAAAAVIVGPWLLKTWLETGAPAWPFGFGAGADAAALAERYLRSNRWNFPPPASLLSHDGPLFLLGPVAVLAALVPRPRAGATPEERALAAASPFFLLATWRHNEAWRFLMPLWPALALFAGRRAAEAWRSGHARGAAAALAVAAGAAPIAAISPNNALFAVVAPRPSSEATDRRALFEERSVDVAAFYRRTRESLPPRSRVLLFREIRGYGAGFDYLWGDPMNQALLDYRTIPTPGALAARLKELGVTHVLDHPSSTLYQEDPGYYDRRTLALMAEALRRHARVSLDDGGLRLYQLL